MRARLIRLSGLSPSAVLDAARRLLHATRAAAVAALMLCACETAQAQNLYSAPSLKAGMTATVVTIKTTKGALTWWYCSNPNAAVVFVQVFDVAGATSVTLGTTVPTAALPLGASQAFGGVLGANYLNGIKAAATTTSTGASAPGAPIDCTFGVQ